MDRNSTRIYLAIIVLSSVLLFPNLGSVHLFDTDEVMCAESSREMILTGDYMNVQIDFEPFPEKPPLFYWLQAGSMKLFGINEFAARFPSAVCGVLTLVLLFFLGSKIYGRRFGIYWVLSYASAMLPMVFFKSGIIDPWFNLLVFLGISSFVFYLDPEQQGKRIRNIILSALFFGLAVLTKGPVGLFIFLICFIAFISMRRFSMKTSFRDVLVFILVLTGIGGSWYIYQLIIGNGEVLVGFIQYQIKVLLDVKSGHDGFFGYHLVVLTLGVFPASVIAIKSITKKSEETELQRLYKQWMYFMIIVVLVLYSLARTKLLHYSSQAYFPLTFLAAWVWEKWVDRKIEIASWQVILIFLIALFFSLAAISLPLLVSHRDWLVEKDFFFMDTFTSGALRRDVHWSGFEWLVGLFLLIGSVYALFQVLWRNARGMLALHIVVFVFVSFSLFLFTHRIEGYTQRSAVRFYRSLKGQEVYVSPLGFRSYSHLFYFDKPVGEPGMDPREMLEKELDRDAYFVIRLDEKEKYLSKYSILEELYERDGYVFAIKRMDTPSE